MLTKLAIFATGIKYVSINTAMRTDQNDTPVYSIGTVARILNVSVETIRLYERKGLILASRNEGQQRLYSDSDLERLRCIRAAICEHKISIEGIRRLQSMIPCWEHVHCSGEERTACPAFHQSQAGCWTYHCESNGCASRSCRACKVYQLSSNCDSVKELIQHRVVSELHSVVRQEEGLGT